mmetsp:Transcript_23967/g.36739  ORF Transcript_23967/g.36739 Transcript_23967/m.36739 type:complete len:116 (+) Transcript_23967:1485-1832(+)
MAEKVGVCKLTSSEGDTSTILLEGKREIFEIIKVIGFTSTRKRMTVVARRKEDQAVFAFVKGADNVIIPRLAESNQATLNHMEDFAKKGYRTLLFAIKELHNFDQSSLDSEDGIA